MQRMTNETEAKQIAIGYVKIKKPGVYENWVMETQTKETNGTQYANVSVSGTDEIEDYTKSTFQSVSASQRIKSKLRTIFSHGKTEEN